MLPTTGRHIRHAAIGLAIAGATTALARRRSVHSSEVAAFRAVNELPSGMHLPVYAVMQGGSLAAVFVTAAVAGRVRSPRLGATIAVAGTSVWGGCKLVKGWVGRGRPAAHLVDVTIRGKEEAGLGFPSGHAAVATTLAVIAAPEFPAIVRPVVMATAVTVAGARLYVGAHLPLDIVGGLAIGLAAGSLTRLALDPS